MSTAEASARPHLASRARRLAFVTAFALAAGAPACGSAPVVTAPPGPREAVQAYSRALAEHRARDAYAMLSQEARASLPFERFQALLTESPEQAQQLAAALAGPAQTAEVTATVRTRDGDTLLLVLEGGEWRLDASAVDLYGQTSPRAALQAFVRAFDHSRFDVLVRLAPRGERETLTAEALRTAWQGPERAEVEALVAALRAALPSAELQVNGDRATLAYGTSGSAVLVREDGLWRLEELR